MFSFIKKLFKRNKEKEELDKAIQDFLNIINETNSNCNKLINNLK